MSVTLGPGLVVSDSFYEFLHGHQSTLKIARYLLDGWVARNMIRLDLANHLDVVEDDADAGKISYLPPNRWERHRNEVDLCFHEDAFVHVRGRVRGKPGSMLKKVLKDEAFTEPILIHTTTDLYVDPLEDKDVLEFVTALQASFRPVEPFIVTGEAIRYWYYEGNYTQTGSRSMLHTSCMRYGENRGAMRMYAQNPRVIGMACILGSDNKLAGRAILWNTPKGILMDRRYGTDAIRRALVNFAIKHGWSYRTHNDPGEYHITTPDESNFGNVVVPLQRKFTGDDYPYFDTVQNSIAVRKSGDLRYERMPNHIRERDNPFVYAGVIFGRTPEPFHSIDYSRASEETRNQRVNILTDFSEIGEWPAELLRSDPRWQLEDPEDDAANAALPERVTEAATFPAPPPPPPTSWTIRADGVRGSRGTGNPVNYNQYTTHLNALRDLMRTLDPDPPATNAPPTYTFEYNPIWVAHDEGFDAALAEETPW